MAKLKVTAGTVAVATVVTGCALGPRQQQVLAPHPNGSVSPSGGPWAGSSAGAAAPEAALEVAAPSSSDLASSDLAKSPPADAGAPSQEAPLDGLAAAAEEAAGERLADQDPDLVAGSGPEMGGSVGTGELSADGVGADAGWPQCPAGMGIAQKKSHGGPMPPGDSTFVILGVTNGPGFTPNPCLASQVDWVRNRSIPLGAYAVVSQPSAAQVTRYGAAGPYGGRARLDRLRNSGYAQATQNLATMKSAGMDVPALWVDVEPVPDFDWGTDLVANAAVVEGTVRGYRDAGMLVGIYSTPALWRRVVGTASFGLPEWRAAGQTSAAEARRRCAEDWVIQGGGALMGQWVEDNRDRNLICPGRERTLATWFRHP